jgi:hypothetical protein
MRYVIERTADLPHGYRVTFTWVEYVGVWSAWEPDVPQVYAMQDFSRFVAAYDAALDDFACDVATCLRWPLVVQTPDGCRIVEPAVVH